MGSGNHWGLAKVGMAEKVSLEPVMSAAIRSRGVSLVAVTWTTRLREIGTNIYDDAGNVVTALYVNDENLMEDPEGQP
jgi:DNA-binding IclR family transcriptional regulator